MTRKYRTGFPSRRVLFLTLLTIFCGAALTVLFIKMHSKDDRKPDPVFNSLDLKLPFTIPCAPASTDALPVYVALRGRDKRRLKEFFSDRKMVAVPKGMPVRLSSFGATAMVTILHGPHAGSNCFIPSDIVLVIRRPARKPLN